MCAVTEILFVNNSHYFSLKYGAGKRTNNRAEFYALWILMKIAADKCTGKLQVLGDSKLLMDWANNKCRISNLARGPVMNIVLEVKGKFEKNSLIFQGVHFKSRPTF
jgi:ribonuclease HI